MMIGTRDGPGVGLYINVEMIDGAALLFIPAAQAIEMIKKNPISDINDLKEKPCIVEDVNGIARLVE